MRDYSKMLETAKAIQDTFGSAEFTRKEYEKKVGNPYHLYSPNYLFKNQQLAENPLERSKYIVKVSRTEDFVAEDKNGKKFVATRYYYELNENFMIDLRAELAWACNELNHSIANCEKKIVECTNQIEKYKSRIEENKAMMEAFSKI